MRRAYSEQSQDGLQCIANPSLAGQKKAFYGQLYFFCILYSGRKKYIQSPLKRKQLQLIISRVVDAIEDHCFQHLSQHVQGFSVIQYQVLKTYGFFNFNKKFCHATMVEFKQLLKGLSSEI
jgi:hypothetical protein